MGGDGPPDEDLQTARDGGFDLVVIIDGLHVLLTLWPLAFAIGP
jgi:hypothetical protein